MSILFCDINLEDDDLNEFVFFKIECIIMELYRENFILLKSFVLDGGWTSFAKIFIDDVESWIDAICTRDNFYEFAVLTLYYALFKLLRGCEFSMFDYSVYLQFVELVRFLFCEIEIKELEQGYLRKFKSLMFKTSHCYTYDLNALSIDFHTHKCLKC